ncbi:hypothetical protein MHYP_G00350870 [Metynnis hypsauchen]
MAEGCHRNKKKETAHHFPLLETSAFTQVSMEMCSSLGRKKHLLQQTEKDSSSSVPMREAACISNPCVFADLYVRHEREKKQRHTSVALFFVKASMVTSVFSFDSDVLCAFQRPLQGNTSLTAL